MTTQNIFCSIKTANEITPKNSPVDESATPAKLLQKPVKKKCENKKHHQIHKRKTLDYLPSQCMQFLYCLNN